MTATLTCTSIPITVLAHQSSNWLGHLISPGLQNPKLNISKSPAQVKEILHKSIPLTLPPFPKEVLTTLSTIEQFRAMEEPLPPFPNEMLTTLSTIEQFRAMHVIFAENTHPRLPETNLDIEALFLRANQASSEIIPNSDSLPKIEKPAPEATKAVDKLLDLFATKLPTPPSVSEDLTLKAFAHGFDRLQTILQV